MAQSVTLFGNVITSVLFPAMSSIQEETDRLRQAYLHAMSFVSVLMLPTSAIAFTLAHEIIITLLGSSWVDAVVPFRILALGMYFRVAYKISATLLSSTGAVYTHARREGVYAFLIILGSLICQRWGVGGVATAVLFALVSHFLLLSWAGLRHLSVTLREFLLFQAHGFCLGILAGLMTWGIASGLRHLLLPEAAVLVITLVILSIAASALLLWFPGPVAGEKNLWLVKKTLDLISTKGPRLSRVTSLMGRRLRIIRISRLGI
jgi:PST family polysaccharide transporter